jgi:HSP20 family protein
MDENKRNKDSLVLGNNVEIGDKSMKENVNGKLTENNQYQYKEKLLPKDKDSTDDFFKGAKMTKLGAEKILNELIEGLKEKQWELGKKINDYNNECPTPLTDVLENDSTIIIRVDLPGVKKEDISVNLIEDAIEVMALFPGKEDPGNYIKRERNYGKVIRKVPLSKKINEKAVKSTFKNSILTIELPKLVKDRYKVDIY